MWLNLTDWRVSSPSACYSSIFYRPKIITDCTPGSIFANLHTTLIRNITIDKSDTTTNTTYNQVIHIYIYIYIRSTNNKCEKCLRSWHVTPASSACPLQKSTMPIPPVEIGQSTSLCSLPVQSRSSSQIGPEPWPKKALARAIAPIEENIAVSASSAILCTLVYQVVQIPAACKPR